ncbi:PrpF domain-containing protein [Streptomyces sp. TRM 70351]|uniref:PrpF domain-containing protein n=1 Tax=Streptomyces sp. TRM 70351 TaxID=3116552 RepID=UPI002E7AE8D2|nr:PrpF domain-containing protein [Streptomyces sp. TRM 70351]MEE1929412.1 PrpF domain-containing protein [Streptomyces sp. TRM 70351]
MIGYIARAVGAPTPTLVLDQRQLPRDEEQLRPLLTRIREWLEQNGRSDILKFALVEPSGHPMFDLDYRFVQGLPAGVDRFDFQASCGHSILASVVAADGQAWLPKLTPGGRVRVRVVDNGDQVVCEVDEARRRSGSFTVHFLQGAGARLDDLLLTGNPVDQLLTPSGVQAASLVSMGNPYVFVDATELGLRSEAELFGAGDGTFAQMLSIRTAAAELLQWPTDGVLPKIAAVGHYTDGHLAVRAISVPTWHPSIALTGTTCLAAAASIPGTVPERLARAAGLPRGVIEIDTPSGSTAAAASVAGRGDGAGTLHWVSVSRKLAELHEPHCIGSLKNYDYKEETAWQPLTV